MTAVLDQRGQLLRAALGFAGLLRPSTAPPDPSLLPGLLGRHRTDRRRHGSPRLRPATDPVRRARVASYLLHHGHGALADERDGHRVGADAVARDAAGSVGGAEERKPPIIHMC